VQLLFEVRCTVHLDLACVGVEFQFGVRGADKWGWFDFGMAGFLVHIMIMAI